MRRRQFLVLAPAVLAGAVAGERLTVFAGVRGSSRTQAPAETPVQFQLQPANPRVARVHLLANDGPPLTMSLSSQSAYQGGAVLVRAGPGASGSGSVHILGRTYQLMPAPGGGLAGFLSLGTEDPPGPTPVEVRITGATAVDTATATLTVVRTQWTADYIIIPPPDPNDPDPPPPDLPDEGPRLTQLYQGVSARKWRDGWRLPLNPPAPISGYFGEQRSFNGGPLQGHHGGTDFGVAAGTPVFSTNDGTVVLAERTRVRGRLVVVDHGGGVFSAYAHMSTIAVTQGQSVVQGQQVGEVGSTGLSTAAHLHWELSVGGVLVDGLRWLDGSQGF